MWLRAGTMLVLVGGASLAWSVIDTPREPAVGNLATTTRARELAVGGPRGRRGHRGGVAAPVAGAGWLLSLHAVRFVGRISCAW